MAAACLAGTQGRQVSQPGIGPIDDHSTGEAVCLRDPGGKGAGPYRQQPGGQWP
jgi:hypothetical protein